MNGWKRAIGGVKTRDYREGKEEDNHEGSSKRRMGMKAKVKERAETEKANNERKKGKKGVERKRERQ